MTVLKLQDDCRTLEKREITARRILRDYELRRILDSYEKPIKWKAKRYARVYEDRKDFQQVGREAVLTVFQRIRKGELEVEREHSYYLNSVDHAMLDYAYKLYRKTFFVWHYDKKNGPTRIKRYHYGGQRKARIQYHGNKLTLLYESRRSVQDLIEGTAPGSYSENFFEG